MGGLREAEDTEAFLKCAEYLKAPRVRRLAKDIDKNLAEEIRQRKGRKRRSSRTGHKEARRLARKSIQGPLQDLKAAGYSEQAMLKSIATAAKSKAKRKAQPGLESHMAKQVKKNKRKAAKDRHLGPPPPECFVLF